MIFGLFEKWFCCDKRMSTQHDIMEEYSNFMAKIFYVELLTIINAE